MLRGQRHLIKCRCVLPQYKSSQDPPHHQFVVFSVLDGDNVRTKYAQCNNCDAIHKVTDVCKSDILPGKESMSAIVSVEDVKLGMPANLVDILERHNVDVSTWEQAQFILENKQWGNFVVLASEEDAGARQGKYVRIMSETFFKVESFTREDIVVFSGAK